MKHITGSLFSLGKIVGILLVISLELMLKDTQWRLILSVTLLLAIIQSILLRFVGIDTPYEWVSRGKT